MTATARLPSRHHPLCRLAFVSVVARHGNRFDWFQLDALREQFRFVCSESASKSSSLLPEFGFLQLSQSRAANQPTICIIRITAQLLVAQKKK